MSDLNLIKPKYVQNLINKFCVSIGMIPTSYKNALTYEKQILAIGNYLENVVYPAINNNAEALAELQNLFIELKDYVDNYFDNLDVQQEINNKLDEMEESGVLADIINQQVFVELNQKIDLANSQLITLIDNYSDIFTDPLNKFVMIGDSIAEGYGWWGGNSANKNNQNDGLMALLRNNYPNTNFINLSVSGSTIANITGHANLQTQITQVPNNTTHCFIMSGINDVTVSMNDNNNYIGYPTDKVLSENYVSNIYNTTCSAFESNIQSLLQKNNNMKIYFIIEPTIDKNNYYIYDMCFSFLKFICDKYGVNVIDLRQMFRKYNEPYSSQFFFDKVHPNANGYNLMFSYFRNHVRFDINDNFKETPPCLITDVGIDFNSNGINYNMAHNIGQSLANICPLWQQNFSTILINADDWGADVDKVARIDYTFNYQYGKMRIESIRNIHRFVYVIYYHSNKYRPEITNVTRVSIEQQYFSGDITMDCNYTNLNQIAVAGTYKINYDKLEQITNLHTDLKSSNNGYAYCTVISENANFIIQLWMSAWSRNYIYVAYITDANTQNPQVAWKKIALTN